MLGLVMSDIAKDLIMHSLAFTLLISLVSLWFYLINAISCCSPLGPSEMIVSASIYLLLFPSLNSLSKMGSPFLAICWPKLPIVTQAAALTFQMLF
jgi:hypothetical protein